MPGPGNRTKVTDVTMGWDTGKHTFGVTYTIQIFHRDIGFPERSLDNIEDPLSVVLRGVSGKESFSWRRYVCLSCIGEYFRGTIHPVLDDPCAQLVGRALETER